MDKKAYRVRAKVKAEITNVVRRGTRAARLNLGLAAEGRLVVCIRVRLSGARAENLVDLLVVYGD